MAGEVEAGGGGGGRELGDGLAVEGEGGFGVGSDEENGHEELAGRGESFFERGAGEPEGSGRAIGDLGGEAGGSEEGEEEEKAAGHGDEAEVSGGVFQPRWRE